MNSWVRRAVQTGLLSAGFVITGAAAAHAGTGPEAVPVTAGAKALVTVHIPDVRIHATLRARLGHPQARVAAAGDAYAAAHVAAHIGTGPASPGIHARVRILAMTGKAPDHARRARVAAHLAAVLPGAGQLTPSGPAAAADLHLVVLTSVPAAAPIVGTGTITATGSAGPDPAAEVVVAAGLGFGVGNGSGTGTGTGTGSGSGSGGASGGVSGSGSSGDSGSGGVSGSGSGGDSAGGAVAPGSGVVAGSGGSAVLPATDPLARAGAVASLARGAALAGSLPMTSGLALGAWWLALLLLLAGLALLVIARRWGTAQLH